MEALTKDQFVIRPEQCVIAFGIPLTETGFRADLARDDKDFAKQFQYWGRYHSEIASTVERLEPVLRGLGVQVVRDVPLNEFGQLFRKPEFRVVTLFSHWQKADGVQEASVEFADGLKKVSSIVDEVPDSFSGVIDLCVCHPDELAAALRKRCPQGLVKDTSVQATPSFWLHFYHALFTFLRSTGATYFDAVTRVIEEFVKVARQRGYEFEKRGE